MKRIFYFFAGNISYCGGLALCTSIMITILLALFFFIARFFFPSVIYLHFFSLIKNSVVCILLIFMFLYFLAFGLFEPVKIPAAAKSLREINRNFKEGRLNPEITNENLSTLYYSINNLIIYNLTAQTLISIIFSLSLFGSAYYYLRLTSKIVPDYLYINFLIILALVSILYLMIQVLATYLFTDSMTAYDRVICYNELYKRNSRIRPKSFLNLRFRFNVIIALIFVALVMFVLLIRKLDSEYNLYVILFRQGNLQYNLIIISILLFFVMSVIAAFTIINSTSNSIKVLFSDISRIAHEITMGREAKFASYSLEKEFTDTEYLILEMNREILEYRRNLESRVRERTEELQKALSDLREQDIMIQKQLDMAGTIQRGILPTRINDWNELKFSVRYLFMDKVGGDFYDVEQIGNNKIGIYIADASGHGIPAALVTTMAKVSFGNAFRRYDSPKKIFREVNMEMFEHIKSQEYLTCFMVVIDDEYNVTYSNASHQKALILRKDEARIEHLDTGGLFIGAIEDARRTYEEKTTKLNYGDRLILYTDGIPDAINPLKESYSNERFESIILQNREMQLRELTDSIISDLQNFTESVQMQDDMTLMIIELERDVTINIIRKSRILSNKKQYKEAIEILKEALLEFPDNKNLLYNLAKNYFLANDYSHVAETINSYVKLESGNKYAYYLGGAAYFKMLDYDSAIEYFQNALNIDSNFVNTLFAIGMAYKEKGYKDQARQYFTRIKKIDEENDKADLGFSELEKAE